MNVVWEEKKEPFIFFRKKETILNAQGQFEDQTAYFIGAKKELSLSRWEDVLSHFEAFLAQ